MKNKIILHLPHSSLELPDTFYNEDLLASKEEIEYYNLQVTDLYTDDLFSSELYDSVKAKYSRLFCDVERFPIDIKEEMSKYGRGMIYTKDLKGNIIRKSNNLYKKEVLNNYYNQYHTQFSEKINYELSKNDKVIIIDCHSFGSDVIESMADMPLLPDICIGFNNVNNRNYKLIITSLIYFTNLGYNVMLNYPYKGSIVPNKIKNKKNLYSMMIEINKEVYLNGLNKNERYDKLKYDLNMLFRILGNITLNLGGNNEEILSQQ